MVQNCCVIGCFNKASKSCAFSFHRFPSNDPERLTKWISRISRVGEDGKPWHPSKNDKVCSAHFTEKDYFRGLDKPQLRPDAVPSVFPTYPTHKQPPETSRRRSPRKRKLDTSPSKTDDTEVDTRHHDHDYSFESMEEHLRQTKEELAKVKERERVKSNELKNVTRKLQRRDKKLSELLGEIKELKLLTQAETDTLEENFEPQTLMLIENELNAAGKPKHALKYSDELKSFAVSVHFYSAQAYEYLRKFLHLPHADTIRRWAASYNVEPGFLQDVISALKVQVENDPDMADVCLIFDSMSIRQQVLYSNKTKKYVGFINFGQHNISQSCDRLASEALVFLVVGQKRFFKHPIGYFLVDKIEAKQQAELIKDGLCFLADAGFRVVSIVCDGAFANQATMGYLGCSLKIPGLVTDIPHPSKPDQRVNILFDACHLIKNVRNCLGEIGVIFNNGEKIDWKFIEKLHQFQLESNLHLANKLRGVHLDFVKNKMKVSLAVQTLSSSVATAIDYLREDLQLVKFANSEATCHFIRVFDRLFDLCNSSARFGKGFKSPITSYNLARSKTIIADSAAYIKSLTDANGKSLITGRRKTGFVGFLVTLQSLERVAELLLKRGYSYVLTYRLSQDHLETLFGRIRRRGGWNNNPNVLQFQYALRSLLQKNGVLASSRGNCVPSPESTLFCQDQEQSSNSLLFPSQSLATSSVEQVPIGEKHYAELSKVLSQTTCYHDDVLYYIAGYITRKILTKMKCDKCSKFLASKKPSPHMLPQVARFTSRRDNGGLLYASADIFSIVKTADKVLRELLISDNKGPLLSVSETTQLRVSLAVTAKLGSSIFQDLRDHISEAHFLSEDNHPSQILKEACNIFCKMMLHHHGELFNQRYIQKDRGSVRHRLTKQVLFLHL